MTSLFKVDGMSCHHCIKAIIKEFEKAGLKNFKVELGLVEIDLDENQITIEKLKSIVEEAGYNVANE
jgi:copper chaperone